MNRRIIELREVVTKLVPLLAGKSLRVTQIGKRAYVKTDAVTRRPVLVNIPMIPDNADDMFIDAIQGFIDHEVGHVLCTDWNFYGGAPTPAQLADPKVKAFMNTHNIVEDTMIEREIVRIFPGSEANIGKMRQLFIERITKPAVDASKANPVEQFKYLIVPVMRALSGHTEFIEYMDANGLWAQPLVKHLTDQLDDDYLKRLRAARNTEQTLQLAKELHAILYPPPPPSSKAAESGDMSEAFNDPSDEDEDSESKDKPDQKAGEGDGDGERDHSESEGEEGDEEEAGASGSKPEDEDEGEDDFPLDDDEDESEEIEGEPGEAETDEEDGEDEDKKSDAGKNEDDEGADPKDPEDGDAGDGEGEQDDKEDDTDESEPGSGAEEDDDEGSESGKDDDGDDDDTSDEGESGDAGGDDSDEGDADASGDEDTDDAEKEDDQNGAGDGSDEEGDDGEDAGGGGGDESDEGDAGSDAEENDGLSENEEPDNLGEPDEEDPDGDPSVGTAPSQSMFDFTDDAFDEADMSSALSDLLSKTVEGFLADRNQYVALTRELDQIAPLVPPENINSDWVPKMEAEVASMTGPMQKDIERIMASQSHVLYTPGHRKGKLHAPSLYRVTQGDPRVFRQKEEHISKDTAVSLVVDNSGSMSGAKMKLAMISSYALSNVLDRVKISHEVIGFTTGTGKHVPAVVQQAIRDEYDKMWQRGGVRYDRSEPIVMPIYKDFDERMTPLVKKRMAYAMFAQKGLAGNIDGESIEYAAMRLMKRPEKRKVMLVLSDGEPAGGPLCQPHLRTVIKDCEEKYKIETIGIGIMSSAVSRFYPRYVILRDLNELPGQIMKEIKKLLA